jgi:hypothetical protein
MWIDEDVMILDLEPKIMRTRPIDNSSSMGIDTHSTWIGWDIRPQNNFLDNLKLFANFRLWVEESLLILRFLVNWNLKAQIYFYVEWEEEKKTSKCSIQEEIDLYCKSGGNFYVSFNKVNLVYPLLKKILEFQPSEIFQSILYNHALAKRGNSAIIDYFYEFAVLDGFISNWAIFSGYSELWGESIAISTEQRSIHESLRSHFQEFYKTIKKSGVSKEKLAQLNSLIDINFPDKRMIRRSLHQRLKSYIEKRLPQKIRENEIIKSLIQDFRNISNRRNIIGHSLGDYTRLESFATNSEILYSSLKILMDFEIEKFIEGEIDWKFEKRTNEIISLLSPKTQEKILDKFLYSSSTDLTTENYIQSKDMKWDLKTIEFKLNISPNDNDVNENNTINDKYLKIFFKENPNSTINHTKPKKSNIIDINDNPECLIYSSNENITQIFKITNFPTKINIITKNNSLQISSEIDPSIIRTIIKLENVVLSPDLDFYDLLCTH